MLSPMLSFLALGTLNSILAVPLEPRQAPSFPNPEACNGNCSYIHDPSLVQASDGTWFRFSTNGNIAIATAPDITGPWTYQGAMLPQGSSIQVDPNQQIWVSCSPWPSLHPGLGPKQQGVTRSIANGMFRLLTSPFSMVSLPPITPYRL